MLRHTPRVFLRHPRRGQFADQDVLVLEMGLGGAKLEHAERLDLQRAASFRCGPLTTEAVVRHSVLLPGREGMLYQSGIAFPSLGAVEHQLLLELLVHEATEQVAEWEANLRGEPPPRPARSLRKKSAAAPRFIVLHHLDGAWTRSATIDPNQPADGITLLDGTGEQEIALLRETYERGDAATRELMRRTATLAILEQMRTQ